MQGSISAYSTKAGERRYRIRWDERPGADGKRRQRTERGFTSKKAASARLAEVAHGQLNQGRTWSRSTVTVGEFASAWLADRGNLAETSVDNLRTCVEAHIVPRLGARRMQELTSEDVATFYRDLATSGKRNGACRTSGVTCGRDNDCAGADEHAGLKAKSVGHVATALRAICALAVEDGLLPSNPCDTTRARQARQRRNGEARSGEVTEDMFWSAEQARAFLDLTGEDPLAAMWTVLLGTGLRRGEVVGLRWDDIDLDAGTLKVRRSTTVVRGEPVERDVPKTRASRRTVQLGPELVAVLRDHRKRQAEQRLAAGPVWSDSGHVFTEADGRPVHPSQVSKRFARACSDAGMPNITPHGTRHTHASALLIAGVPITAVQQRLGHENAAITLSTYSHVIPADDALAAEATSRILFA